MRFQIFGGLDAPDWILANVAVLSTLLAENIYRLSIGIMKDIVGETEIEITESLERLKKLKGLKEKKMVISTLRYIIENGSRFSVTEDVFTYELQQIGFPKDSSEALCKAYRQYKVGLVAASKTKTMRLPRLHNLNWRVDYVLGSSKIQEIHKPTVHLSIDVANENESSDGKKNAAGGSNHSFEVGYDKFRVLHHELKQVKNLMKKVQE